ncbi:hypothetical protein CTI12_AA423310 [Artemisia annua]|uniref:B3 domain-containing protein, DNA-binding pseudobarrel domain protein n=1 Tax=Artemisia annua TaxID=35608 RepID=A0A2U1M3L3_ARTAN|nr:hypothetical protein CTI12_AA423310 [Artemisia annua]
MAFSPYKRAPRLLSLLNVGPRECRPMVTSTWIDKLPPDAKLCPKDYLSLGITAPPVTTSSSFIDRSRMANKKKLNLPKELVDAAKSFTLFLSPNDEASVSKSSVINHSDLPIRSIPTKNNTNPTCEVTLAALVKEPVNEKRTKRIKCEPVVSSHANEELQIVCWDPSANQVKEPDNKKRKIPPKVDCGPVVKNEVTERLQKFITDDMNGSDIKLVIQKTLFLSDLKPDQNRLNLPRNQLITEDFLTTEERFTLLEKKEKIEVRLIGPTLKMYKEPMGLKMWSMPRTENFVLKTKWNQFVEENKDYLKLLSMIQLWSFRKDQQLCFALAVVEGPPYGVNVVA